MSGKGIYIGYHNAGADFLAYRLGKLFVRIETPEDMALHNDVLSEVLAILEGQEKSFFKSVAHLILYEQTDRRKRFLFAVACRIFNIGQGKDKE